MPKYAKKCQNPARRPKNDPPSGQTATYRKTEVIQSCLRIWGTYDPIESGSSEPKKWGFHRCSVKKCRILGRKCSFLARNPFFLEIVQFLDALASLELDMRLRGSPIFREISVNKTFGHTDLQSYNRTT